MTLSACSSNRLASIEMQTVVISVPDSLMQHFCEFQAPGDTVGTLAEGYVNNTVCGKKYQAQLDEQKEFLKNVKKNTLSESKSKV